MKIDLYDYTSSNSTKLGSFKSIKFSKVDSPSFEMGD